MTRKQIGFALWRSMILLTVNGEESLPPKPPSNVDQSRGCYVDMPQTEGSLSVDKHGNDCTLPCPAHATCDDGMAECFPDNLYNMIHPETKTVLPYCEITDYAQQALEIMEKGLIAITKRRVCGAERDTPPMPGAQRAPPGKQQNDPNCKPGQETCPAVDPNPIQYFTIKDLMQYLIFSGSLDDFDDIKDYQITIIFLSTQWKRNLDIRVENFKSVQKCIMGGFEGLVCSKIRLGFTETYANTVIVGRTGCLSVWAFSKIFGILTYFVKPQQGGLDAR